MGRTISVIGTNRDGKRAHGANLGEAPQASRSTAAAANCAL